MKFNVWFEVAGAAFLLIIYIYIRLQYSLKSETTRQFAQLVLLVLLAESLDVVTGISINMANIVPYRGNVFLNTLYLAVSAMAQYQFACYVDSYIVKPQKKSLIPKVGFGIAVGYMGCLLVNLFNGLIFSFDDTGTYLHGPIYFITFLLPVGYMLCGMITLLTYRKFFTRIQTMSILLLAAMVILGTLAQLLLFPNVLLGYFGCSLGILIGMFALETPDYQQLIQTMEELQKSKDATEAAKASAIEANRAKENFLSTVSQNIRTSVNAVIGYSGMILQESKEEKTVSYATNVQEAGHALLNIMNDITSFKAQQGRIEDFDYKEEEKKLTFTAPKAKILIAEDTLMNQELMKGLLQNLHVQIDFVENGAEALKRLKKERYDIVFLDYLMPEMDGMATLEAIRREQLCAGVPMIAMTATADAGAREQFLQSGFDDYIAKPIIQEALLDRIRKYLPKELIEWEALEEIKQKTLSGSFLLDRLTFLDTQTGLAFCGNDEAFYEEMLHTFLENDRRDEMSRYFANKDWTNYQIVIHALKGTALTIGAVPLSEQAKLLEQKAKEQNTDYIEQNHADFMKQYHHLLTKIENALQGIMPAESGAEAVSLLDEETTILVVDDDLINLKVAQKMLGVQYIVDCVKSGEECLKYLKIKIPNLILLDLHMPGMDGFEVLKRIKSMPQWAEIPVFFLTADNDRETEVRGFEAGAMDFITKPFIAEVVLQRVNRLLELHKLQKFLKNEVARQTEKAEERRQKVEQMSLQTVQTLANAIDAKDQYTNGHSIRVSEYAALIAGELGWSEEEIENLRYAALLHDIGKIGVPDTILNKPSKLTDTEYELIQSHTKMGGDILANITTIPGAENVARYHHERYDGKGYPEGLKKDEIPMEARIVCVADTYDAMNSRRIYRKALKEDIIRHELEKGRGQQFDPDVLDAFLSLIDSGRLIINWQETEEVQNQDEGAVDASSIILQKVMQTITSQKNSEEIDFLTGLPLRGIGQSQIAKAMQDEPGCLAFLDIDNLKKINDTMGHKSGDRVLKLMGDILSRHSDNAIACRLGGDEFLMYFYKRTEDEVRDCVEQIIKEFLSAKEEDVAIHVASLSVGLCMSTPMEMFEDVYNNADKALYHVKQNGKSGYFFYQKEEADMAQTANVDLQKLMRSIRNSGEYLGAMDVEYREFAKLFEYVNHLSVRYDHGFHLMMITLNKEQERMYIEEMEYAMECMEESIKKAIRNVDICTRYSSMQFLVILFEVGDENIQLVVDRMFNNFYKKYGQNNIQPVYAVEKVEQADNS